MCHVLICDASGDKHGLSSLWAVEGQREAEELQACKSLPLVSFSGLGMPGGPERFGVLPFGLHNE